MTKLYKKTITVSIIAIIGIVVYYIFSTSLLMATASQKIRLQMAKDFDKYYAEDYDFENDTRNSNHEENSDILLLKSGTALIHEDRLKTEDSQYIEFIPEELVPRKTGSKKDKDTSIESYYFVADKPYKECQIQKKKRMKVFSDYFNKHFDYFNNEIKEFNERVSYIKTTNFVKYKVPTLITVCTQDKMITLFGIVKENNKK